ncbi:adenylate kinase family enzyme [Paenibacillus rhizosphaerae]|uniref:Adenylate kinase family enzyme n=1 Tax=Paenibacillus rhizosphaerae TaxID=297318 RepID=A0A839TRQ2_9BACL|nr:DNA topology modulation protein [Paenibacillus rhizosphaerae]MBB3129506.1 adenylate kinase family enzyme [Paenibacillus rhizosphaerae]
MTNRIAIIGSAGSGKSTLSQKLGEILSLPVVHLDRFYWKPNWTPTANDEWDEFVKDAVSEDQWIIDGNYTRTLGIRLNEADAVIFLDMPRLLCIYRIMKRRIRYHGKTRPDLNEECPEKLDWAFFIWVWNYKKRSRSKVMEALEQVKGRKQVVILKSRKEVQEFLDQVKNDGKI